MKAFKAVSVPCVMLAVCGMFLPAAADAGLFNRGPRVQVNGFGGGLGTNVSVQQFGLFDRPRSIVNVGGGGFGGNAFVGRSAGFNSFNNFGGGFSSFSHFNRFGGGFNRFNGFGPAFVPFGVGFNSFNSFAPQPSFNGGFVPFGFGH